MFQFWVAALVVISPAFGREFVTSTFTLLNIVTETVTNFDETVCLKYIGASTVCKDRRNYLVDEFGAVEVQYIEPEPVHQLGSTELPKVSTNEPVKKRKGF